MVLRPGAEDRARAIFEKWELDFAVIGQVTESGRLELRWRGETVADLPEILDDSGWIVPSYNFV